MKIAFLVNHVHLNGGWTPNDTRLGGTEEGIVEWSRRLVARGHEVTVYQNGYIGSDRGVTYKDRLLYNEEGRQYDATFNHKALDMAVYPNTFYFTTETDAGHKDLSHFEAVVWPSHWAKTNIAVNNPHVWVIHYGYDPERIYPSPKMPKTVLYASSPDRGLDEFHKFWPDVVKAVPEAQLIVTYGGQIDLPNTMCVGSISADEMDLLYRESDIWCHPCTGGELFGITAVKAQAANCWPIFYPTMALAETVRAGDVVHTPEEMAACLIEALKNGRPILAPELMGLPTWDSTTDDLEALVSP